VLQRSTLFVQSDRRLTEWVGDGRCDGLLTVWISDQVIVLEHHCLAVGQAQHHQRTARLVLTDRRDAAASRNRQGNALEFGAISRTEKQGLTFI
jgi:hypothetical protein